MKAMILAAGIGSRLSPLTDRHPKALIDIAGHPMLEIVLRRLIATGVDAAIVNVFHLPDQISAFLKARKNFGIRIEISHETELLDTGGGLKKAERFFDDGKPFFLHNVDVVSAVDLKKLYSQHIEQRALATLSVRARQSGRRLIFDQQGELCGWQSCSNDSTQMARSPAGEEERLAFDGIHVISPEIFPKITEQGTFSIIESYLRLSGLGERISAFRSDQYYWRDIGGLGKLAEVRRYAAASGLPI